MMKLVSLLTFLGTVLVFLLPAASAQAQRDRVFVASYGSDSNPCTFGSPCKTFQNAVNVVAQGGEVTAIDSAGFGTFTISHAVTVTSPNGVEAGIAAPASGAAAITINAEPGDYIVLSGLTLDGDGVTNTTGIVFNSGTSLNIQNSVIRNFTNDGIGFQPNGSNPSQLAVSNTQVSDNNGATGIYISAAGSGSMIGVLDHVDAENNGNYGLYVASSGPTVNVTVSESVIANGGYGIAAFSLGTPANVMVRDSTIANNGSYGLFAQGAGAGIWVTRSMITGNQFGWSADVTATVTSLADNIIVNNTNYNTQPPSIAYK
jgi:hypothetical protein